MNKIINWYYDISYKTWGIIAPILAIITLIATVVIGLEGWENTLISVPMTVLAAVTTLSYHAHSQALKWAGLPKRGVMNFFTFVILYSVTIIWGSKAWEVLVPY
jgi:uncharacterized membrane protein